MNDLKKYNEYLFLEFGFDDKYTESDISETFPFELIFIDTVDVAESDGSPHVEYEGDELHYVITERGSEYERRKTKNPDDILFWLVSDMTFSMASDFELNNRIETEDFRIQLFSKDLELLNSINNNWAEKLRVEYNKLLPGKFERIES